MTFTPDIFKIALSLFIVMNALGNTPLVVGLLSKFNVKRQRQIILREMVIALSILLAFNYYGDEILGVLGINESIVGIAGGTVLFLIALGMIFPKAEEHEAQNQEPFIVPLAIPLLAGPGSMTTVMLFAKEIPNQWDLSLAILLAWLPSLVILLMASNLSNFLGQKGLLAMQKLGGLIISLLSVNMFVHGVVQIVQTSFLTK